MVSSKVTAAVSVAKRRVFTVGLIAAWYMSNFGIVLLNRYLLSSYGFHFPIFLTMCHMAACALLSYVVIACLQLVPIQRVRSHAQFVKIAALSVIFCASVVGGNIALRYLPVSSTQAVGATTPVFTAVFAYLVTLRCEAWITYAVPVVAGVIIASGVRANFWNNVPIVAGVSVGSVGESKFHLYGFIMCIGAAAARALKSVLQGILLSSEGDKLSSMNLLLYMSPIAFLVLLPATLILEPNVMAIFLSLARQDKFMISMLLVNSSMAYLVNLTNFLVTKHTSPLTLQVLGNAKGAVAFVVSILLGV